MNDPEKDAAPEVRPVRTPRKPARRVGPVRVTVYAILFFAVLIFVVGFLTYRDQLTADTFTGLFSQLRAVFGKEPGETSDTFVYDDYMLTRFSVFQRGLALLSDSRLALYGPSGRQTYVTDCFLKEPALAVSDRTLLAYDRGGTSLLWADAHATLSARTWPDILFHASMNPRGDTVIVSRERGFSSVVTVLNTRFEEVFKWYSSDLYVLDAVLSPSGKRLCVVSAGQEDGQFLGRVLLFDIGKDTPLLRADLPDVLPLAARALVPDLFCVVTENELLFYGGDGASAGTYAFGARSLLAFDAGEDFVAVCLGDSDAVGIRPELLSVSPDGPRASVFLNGAPDSLSAAGRFVGLLSSGTAHVYDADLNPTGPALPDASARHLLMRADGSALLLAQNGARVYHP
ncbi:MAG: DUF5711 family protein [Oscillospiraceae bacterium]|nr:DUF5711 family protein [Oscillospiraceae bacterium]